MNKECKYCKKNIQYDIPQQLGNHISNCKENPNRKSNKHELLKYNFNCLKCCNEYKLELSLNNYNKGKYKKFCSRSCANSRIISEEQKETVSKKLTKDKPEKIKLTSKESGSIGGKKSSYNKKQYDSNMITYIYALCDENNNIRYIGKANDVNTRYKNHLKESKRKRTHKEKWINSMLEKGLKPGHFILDECIYSDWILMEEYWIAQAKSWGFNLTNGTSGGDGSDGFRGKKHTQETKDKLRQISTGRTFISKHKGENSPKCKITDNQIKEIKDLFNNGKSCKEIGLLYNISRQYINKIIKNKKRVLI